MDHVNALDLATGGTDAVTWGRTLDVLPRKSSLDLVGRRLVVVAPHPDDETLGAGGIIAEVARRGTPVVILSITDGEAADVGDRTFLSGRGLGSWRLRELRDALQLLAPYGSLRTVRCGLPDGGMEGAEQTLRDILASEFQPGDLVLAPLPNDGHSDHDVVGAASRDVAHAIGATCMFFPVWAWHSHSPESSDIAACGIRIELSSEAQVAKAAALRCFVSQTSGAAPVLTKRFLRRFDQGYEVLVEDAVDAGSRAE